MTMKDHSQLLATALSAVVEASAEIMRVYSGGVRSQFKDDGSPVTEADFNSNRVLLNWLRSTNIPVISEESVSESYSKRKNWERCWSVDPLDGTKEFLKKNDEFAICIALIEHGAPTLGVIASPVKQEILAGGTKIPAATIAFDGISEPRKWTYLEPKITINQPLVLAGSRTPHSGATLEYFEELQRKFGEVALLKKGSALKFFDLALGAADVYPRFAPTMEWDIAAGHAIVASLGGEVVNPESGLPLTYNKENLLNPHFIVKTKAFLHAESN